MKPIFYYQVLISGIRCNFLQSFNKFFFEGFRATLNFQIFKVALNSRHKVWKFCQKLCHILLINVFFWKDDDSQLKGLDKYPTNLE